MMNDNLQLLKDVQDALKWEPFLNAAEIAVTVKDGVVTLTGVVDNYTKRTEAVDIAKNVLGVKAVHENIEVVISNVYSKINDNEITMASLNAFKWNCKLPNNKIKVTVENGWITLEGELEWNYQKEAAESAIQDFVGVTRLSNNIKIKSKFNENIQKSDIERALKRHWSIYENDIDLKISGHKATLTGKVDYWYQKEEAGRIAFNAPGVWALENELIVDYDYSLMHD